MSWHKPGGSFLGLGLRRLRTSCVEPRWVLEPWLRAGARAEPGRPGWHPWRRGTVLGHPVGRVHPSAGPHSGTGGALPPQVSRRLGLTGSQGARQHLRVSFPGCCPQGSHMVLGTAQQLPGRFSPRLTDAAASEFLQRTGRSQH